MKTTSREVIDEEEFELRNKREELQNLKGKWIKIPPTLRTIEFLEEYIKLKEKFIESIKQINKIK